MKSDKALKNASETYISMYKGDVNTSAIYGNFFTFDGVASC